MHKLFYQNTNSLNLSNTIRIIFYLWLFIILAIPLIGFSQNAYINDFRVNDDLTNRGQFGSRIGVDSAGNFVVAWNDRRNSININYTQVFYQIFDKYGSRIGSNIAINTDTNYLSGLTVFKTGQFIITWIRIFNSSMNSELYFQRFDKTGIPLNPPTKVIDTVYSSTALNYGDVASDSNGNFVTVWEFRPYATTNSVIYAQRFDNVGNKLGTPIVVNDTIGFFGITDVNIAMDGSGKFIVSWSDRRFNVSQQKYDIFFQRFNSIGIKIGNNVKVNDDNDTTKNQLLPWLCSDRNGRFVITWTDRRNLFNEYNIYFQIYDSTGTKVGNNKRADESNGDPYNSNVAINNLSQFIIGWTDDGYAGRLQYYGRRYTKTGDIIGNIYMVPQISPVGSIQSPSDIKIFGDRIYSTWEDTRNSDGDIYCNVRSFQNPDTIIIGINTISANEPTGFKLYPAYPNPFNPETKIKYDLSINDDVFVSIYDITGKTIKQINTGKQNKGTYEITITNELLSSGVYFLKIQTSSGLNAVQKLVLLK